MRSEIRMEEVELAAEPVLQPVEEKLVQEKPAAPPPSDMAVFMRRARAVVPTAIVGLFLLALIAFLYFAKPFAMPIVLALFLTFLLKPVVRVLHDMRIPQTLGAIIVIAVFFLVATLAITQLSQPATQWLAKAPEMVEEAREKFHMVFRRAERLSRAAAQVESIASTTGEKTPQVEVKQPVLFNTVITYTKSFVFGAIETVVLLFFMLAAGDLFLQKLVKVLPTLHDKKKAVEIAHEVQHSISTFLFTITAINAVLGLFVGLAAYFIGLPNPVLWGVLAGALNFIPYFGPITGVVVLLIAGFLTFESPLRAVCPSLIYLGLHGLESNIITPMILGRRLTLNPLVIFISLMFWTWLWGVPGALLSIPMLMMLKILCDHFKPLAPVGEFMSG
jgi:predicted PurR-regulated permease PerM